MDVHIYTYVKHISQGRGKTSYYKGQGGKDNELTSEHVRINVPAQVCPVRMKHCVVIFQKHRYKKSLTIGSRTVNLSDQLIEE